MLLVVPQGMKRSHIWMHNIYCMRKFLFLLLTLCLCFFSLSGCTARPAPWWPAQVTSSEVNEVKRSTRPSASSAWTMPLLPGVTPVMLAGAPPCVSSLTPACSGCWGVAMSCSTPARIRSSSSGDPATTWGATGKAWCTTTWDWWTRCCQNSKSTSSPGRRCCSLMNFSRRRPARTGEVHQNLLK